MISSMAPSRGPVVSIEVSAGISLVSVGVLVVAGTVVGMVVGAVAALVVGVDVSPFVGRVGTFSSVFMQPQPTSSDAARVRTSVKIANFFIRKPPIFLCAKLVFPENDGILWEYVEKKLAETNSKNQEKQ
jgi:hypothetical protein